jgi:hypothetical protein
MSDPTRVPPNRTAKYRGRDLRCEGSWTTDHARYGLVAFNEDGQVLLREPADHFGGYWKTFIGGSTNSADNFYLVFDTQSQVGPQAVERNKETWSVRWATREEAVGLTKKTTDGGRERDLETLHAAYEEFQSIMAGVG